MRIPGPLIRVHPSSSEVQISAGADSRSAYLLTKPANNDGFIRVYSRPFAFIRGLVSPFVRGWF